MFPVEVKEVSSSLEMGPGGTYLESCGKDTGKSGVEAEAAPESPRRRALGSAPQKEGKI